MFLFAFHDRDITKLFMFLIEQTTKFSNREYQYCGEKSIHSKYTYTPRTRIGKHGEAQNSKMNSNHLIGKVQEWETM